MKNMKKGLVIGIVFLLLAGCSEDDNNGDNNGEQAKTPVSPTLSLASVTVEEGESREVNISGGVSPYSVSISPLGIAGTALNGSKLIITGIVVGDAIATVHGSDGGKTSVSITVVKKPVDVHSAFKADATLRVELSAGNVIYNMPAGNEPSPYIFYRDKGNELFSSPKIKIGYAARDASSYFFVEWDGDISLGIKSNPALRTESGVVSINSMEIVQVKDRTIWIAWISNASSGRLVQRWE
jgi:hypothetical protein